MAQAGGEQPEGLSAALEAGRTTLLAQLQG
jgi:hypothetical protein